MLVRLLLVLWIAAFVGCRSSPRAAPPPVVIALTAEAADRPAASARRSSLTPEQQARASELMKLLRDADKADRKRLLAAMRSDVGGAGLVMALDTVVDAGVASEATRWFQTLQLMTMIQQLADPDAADELLRWANKQDRHPHWRAEAAVALARVGDLRAAPLLAARMQIESIDLYPKEKFWQANAGGHLSRTDRPRIVAARLLAELAQLHPEEHDRLRRDAEEAVAEWLSSRPQPHANGLRFLAAVKTKRLLPRIRAWAFPEMPLPPTGARPPFPREYETAQVALRYIGALRDPASLDALIAQLARKDPSFDGTIDGLNAGVGVAVKGMALRAVATGAANGLAEWGPSVGPRAVTALRLLIDDPLWNEEARRVACRALAWVAPEHDLVGLVEKAVRLAEDADPRRRFISECYAITIATAGARAHVDPIVVALSSHPSRRIHRELAAALGRAGVTRDARERLLQQERGIAALLLAGQPEDAATFLARLPADRLVDLRSAYDGVGSISVRDLERGALGRWLRNARAAAPHDPRIIREVEHHLAGIELDDGPHSLTRVFARVWLMRAARRGDPSAIDLLAAMGERGVLMALARDRDPHAQAAAAALAGLQHEEPAGL